MRSRNAAAAAALVLVLAASSHGGQENSPWRTRIVALPDLDGDGAPEYAVTTTMGRGTGLKVCTGGLTKLGTLWTADGIDAAAVPDQDGDGGPDVVIAGGRAPDQEPDSWAVVRNGKSGKAIRSLPSLKLPSTSDKWWFDTVRNFGDADGDGRPELLAVYVKEETSDIARWCDEVAAFVVSLDGRVVADLQPVSDASPRWVVAAAVGDLDGDGRADAAVATGAKSGKDPYRAVSIAKGLLFDFGGDPQCRPTAVVPLGDANGDGTPDVLVAVPRPPHGGSAYPGEVRVVSGRTGRLVRTATGSTAGAKLGTALAVLGDVDGDGVGDFVASEPWVSGEKKGDYGCGVVRAFSGRTAKQIWIASGTEPGKNIGIELAALTDVDGDGVADVLALVVDDTPAQKDTVVVISGKKGTILRTVPR